MFTPVGIRLAALRATRLRFVVIGAELQPSFSSGDSDMAKASIAAAGFQPVDVRWRFELNRGRAPQEGDELQEVFTDRVYCFSRQPDRRSDQPDGLQTLNQCVCRDCRTLRVCRVKQHFMGGHGYIPKDCFELIILCGQADSECTAGLAVPVTEHQP